MNGVIIDIVNNFKYLGVTFSSNGSYINNNLDRIDRARKAMFSVLNKSKNQGVFVDIQVELFDAMIAPVATYGSEVWGYSNLEMFNKLQLRYYKYILKLKKATPNFMVLGEIGKLPLSITIKLNMLKFWFKLAKASNTATGADAKIAVKMYKSLKDLADSNLIKCKWLDDVKNILNECGMGFIWNDCSNVSYEWFCNALKLRLQDQSIQKWFADLSTSQKGYNYRLYKTEFKSEEYLNADIPTQFKTLFCKFRTCNHKLPVERGRYQNIPRQDRYCTICDDLVIGDKCHFILECVSLKGLRQKYLPKYYLKHPSAVKFGELMSTTNKKVLVNLIKYIKEATAYMLEMAA